MVVGPGRQGWDLGDEGVGDGREKKVGEKCLGRKLMVGDRRRGWEMGESTTPCPPPLHICHL